MSQISILVFLDFNTGREELNEEGNGDRVSILVFLDFNESGASSPQINGTPRSFNPCFLGF